MLPVGDDNTGRVRTPYVTHLFIALNVLVFVFLQGLGTNEKFTYAFATVPQEIRTGEDIARPVQVQVGDDSGTIPLQPTPGSVYFTLLMSMFMHGSLMHLLGSMLFLRWSRRLLPVLRSHRGEHSELLHHSARRGRKPRGRAASPYPPISAWRHHRPHGTS